MYFWDLRVMRILLFAGLVTLVSLTLNEGVVAEDPLYVELNLDGSSSLNPGDAVTFEVLVSEDYWGNDPLTGASVEVWIDYRDPVLPEWKEYHRFTPKTTDSQGEASFPWSLPESIEYTSLICRVEASKPGHYTDSDYYNLYPNLEYMYADFNVEGKDRIQPGQEVRFSTKVRDDSGDILEGASAKLIIVLEDPNTGKVEYIHNSTPVLTDDAGGAELFWKTGMVTKEGQYSAALLVTLGGYRPYYDYDYISVRHWDLDIFSHRQSLLPGQDAKIFYSLSQVSNGAGVNKARVDWSFCESEYRGYPTYDYGFKELDRGNFEMTHSVGSFKFTVGKDLTSEDYTLRVWVNSTDGSKSAYETLNIDIVENLNVGIYIDGYQSAFQPGEVVVFTVNSDLDYYTPAQGGTLEIEITKSGTTDSQYRRTTLVNNRGRFTDLFTIPEDANEGTTFTITANLSLGDLSDEASRTFLVEEPEEHIQFNLMTDRDFYGAGDTVTVRYELSGNGERASDTYFYWRCYDEDNYNMYDQGRVWTNLDSSFSFVVPVDYIEGILAISAIASDEELDHSFTATYIEVRYSKLVIMPEKDEYYPGETVKVNYHFLRVSDATYLRNVELYYTVNEGYGDFQLAEGKVVNTIGRGSFSFKLPTSMQGYDDDWEDLYIDVTAKDEDNNLDSDGAYIDIVAGFRLVLEFDRPSYNPGDEMVVNYKVLTMVSGSKFSFGVLELGFLTGMRQQYFIVKSEGSISYTLPSSLGSGSYLFYYGADINDQGTTSDYQTVTVKDSAVMTSFNGKVFGVDSSTPVPLLALIIAIAALAYSFMVSRNSIDPPIQGTGQVAATGDPIPTSSLGPQGSQAPASVPSSVPAPASSPPAIFPPMVTIQCPGCQGHMDVAKLGQMQTVKCESCGMQGKVNI